ncbi:hypothetical protein [Massilia oculi]|uniref:hypothetical protein n=1 Tax=Massilia oculi TaxID=945844 RepID=UPI001AAE1C3B|nr:hypothetical protein [Massilia oculi]
MEGFLLRQEALFSFGQSIFQLAVMPDDKNTLSRARAPDVAAYNVVHHSKEDGRMKARFADLSGPGQHQRPAADRYRSQ